MTLTISNAAPLVGHNTETGTCVGKRNYRYFLSLVNTLTVLFTYQFIAEIYLLADYTSRLSDQHTATPFVKALQKYYAPFCLMIITFLVSTDTS